MKKIIKILRKFRNKIKNFNHNLKIFQKFRLSPQNKRKNQNITSKFPPIKINLTFLCFIYFHSTFVISVFIISILSIRSIIFPAEFCQKMKDSSISPIFKLRLKSITILPHNNRHKIFDFLSFFYIFFSCRKNVFEMITRNRKKYLLTCCPLFLAPCFTFFLTAGKFPENVYYFPSFLYVASDFIRIEKRKKFIVIRCREIFSYALRNAQRLIGT